MLAASAALLPLLAAASCDVPDPLAGPPKPSRDVRVLIAAMSTEQMVVADYREVISAHAELSGRLTPLLGEHEEHLGQLRSRLIEPPRPAASRPGPTASRRASAAAPRVSAESSPASPASASGSAGHTRGSAGPSASGRAHQPPASAADALAMLQRTEQDAAAAQLRRLADIMPSLAQLLASIAASESTHVPVLASLQRSGGG